MAVASKSGDVWPGSKCSQGIGERLLTRRLAKASIMVNQYLQRTYIFFCLVCKRRSNVVISLSKISSHELSVFEIPLRTNMTRSEEDA